MWRRLPLAVSCRLLAATECKQARVQHRRWASDIKMTKVLQKMFDKHGGKKKKNYFGGALGPLNKDRDISPHQKPVYSEGKKRRAQQVGKVLYDNIVHLVNSGELSEEIAACAVEVVKVKVVPDFSAVNIYWLADGTKADTKLEMLLKQHEGRLRQLLSSLYILGHIPRINFVRDDSRAHYMKVEKLLSQADFGPDFIPTRLDTSICDDIIYQSDKETSVQSAEERLQEEFSTISLDNSWQTVKGSEAGVSQPSSLDVEQLGEQFLTEATESSQRSAVISNETALPFEGFRDDLYGVPYTALINKVLERKHKTRTRGLSSEPSHSGDSMAAALNSTALKSMLTKKQKGKGRDLSVSDYQWAGVLDYYNSNATEDSGDVVWDEFDEEIQQQGVEDEFTK